MDEANITPNTSNQELLGTGDNDSNDSATTLLQSKSARRRDEFRNVTPTEHMTVAILCFINLINYMDRFTIAGVLGDVQKDFDIGNDSAGLLQTVFVVAYMVFAPIFGYLGDRYSRRYIMAFGVALWSLTTMLGSFMTGFGTFAFFRGLVGIGEASYSTIAPTIISDLFIGNLRSKMLAIFYFAIPVGSGLGYIVGSLTASAAGDWRWALRVTPFLGAAAVALIVLLMNDPERGQAESSHMEPTSYKEDIKSLVKNRSFMLSTLAFTCVSFVTGALAWWGPQYITLGLSLQDANISEDRVALSFGGVTMAAGVIGVPLGSWLGARLQAKFPRSHPLVCGAGLLISAPLMAATLLLAHQQVFTPFLVMFFAQIALNLNWAIVADMSMYVVIPPRRSTAEAFQILISHMLGDAGSPYLIGVISESLKRSVHAEWSEPASPVSQFRALQYALFVTCFVEVAGGILFLITAAYIVKDKATADNAIHENESSRAEPSHVSAQDANSPD